MRQALATALAATVLAAAAAPAHAADDGMEEASRFSLLVGGGASVQPLYEGSDEYRVAPFPIIAPSFGVSDGPRRFEFRALDDVRVHLVHWGRLSLGPLAGYRFGRKESDAARLLGLGDVDGGLVVGGFADYAFVDTGDLRLGVDAALSSQVTGDVFGNRPFALGTDYGFEADFAVSVERRFGPALRTTARAGAVFADDEYMRTAFGVNAAQAATSGLAPYRPDGGLKNAYMRLDATVNLTERFELRAGVGYSRLVGDAAASPITMSANQFSASLGAAYRFRF